MNFFSRYKKFFLIIGFLLLIVALGYLIWRVFFSPPAKTPPNKINPQAITNGLPIPGLSKGGQTPFNGNGQLPNSGGENNGAPANKPSSLALGGITNIQALSNDPTLDPTLANGGGIQYYNSNDGHFYKINNQGKTSLLSNKIFHDVQSIVWAPNKAKAVIVYPDGSKILYNFQTQRQVTLPAHWQDFSFSPSNNQLVSKSFALDSENNWLIVSNADGSQVKAIENMGDNAKSVYPSWSPNNQIVAMWTKGVDFNRQEVYFVGLHGENFKSTMIEGRGFEPKWSKTGDRLLYSVYSTATNLNPRLWIVDAQGNNISKDRRDLGLATWAKKCTFASNNEVYCAVPESLPRGAGLFPQLADQTKDDLYKINLTTGVKELLAIPNGAFNISQVIVPAGAHKLYFTDKTTKQIYQMNLP